MSKFTPWCRLIVPVLIAGAGIALLSSTPVRADDAPTTGPAGPPTTAPAGAPTTAPAGALSDDPRFAAWKKFKVGSSVTISGDIKMQGMESHVETMQTLTDVKDDAVTVENKASITMMGNANQMPARTETIKAKSDQLDLKLTGTRDVEAAGKTYKCRVYELVPKNAMAAAAKGTFCISDDVPGGIVQMDITDKTGNPMTFKLTNVDVK